MGEGWKVSLWGFIDDAVTIRSIFKFVVVWHSLCKMLPAGPTKGCPRTIKTNDILSATRKLYYKTRQKKVHFPAYQDIILLNMKRRPPRCRGLRIRTQKQEIFINNKEGRLRR